MANKFIIRKKLVVSGSDSGPLRVLGTAGQLLSVASSSKGNVFAANDFSGVSLLKVSASNFTIGAAVISKGYAVKSVGDSIVVTGSAFLTSLKVPQKLPQGHSVTAIANYSHAQGARTRTSGEYSHAEGSGSIASGSHSHAEGLGTLAQGLASHAEGRFTTASGDYSHAEGNRTKASGSYSHAEGSGSLALGDYSHAQGNRTTASGDYQHVTGQFNATSSIESAFIHGNGTSSTARRNLIYAYGTGTTGVVIISGSLEVNAPTAINIIVPITVKTTTTTTLTNADIGKELLFKNPTYGAKSTDYCTINFPTQLAENFSITLTTLDQTLNIATGSGVVFLNNEGTGLGMNSSVTITSTNNPDNLDEYLTLGDL